MEKIFSLEKNWLVIFSCVGWRTDSSALHYLEETFLTKKRREKLSLRTVRIRFQFFQKLYKEAECEEQQFFRFDLYLIIKILKAGFVIVQMRASDFREFYNSPRQK